MLKLPGISKPGRPRFCTDAQKNQVRMTDDAAFAQTTGPIIMVGSVQSCSKECLPSRPCTPTREH